MPRDQLRSGAFPRVPARQAWRSLESQSPPAGLQRSPPQTWVGQGKPGRPSPICPGDMTPGERVPELVQKIMLAAPTTHFVELSQAILYRGAGLDVVWKLFLALAAIGSVLFALSLARFRKTISQMA